ncbi:acetyltransferase : GCN5-like protein N-acetyltransferase OS=uncultured bacterium GN=ACD_34C00303G0003 PE=4 SV=1: Acetyltransf_1 [Gemmata massiliana]|uniref:N-acetyltransferase domain-containing protein n=1 Tax=Gemmata massiliana TaxID=1210884 RepID=A0A6P2CSK9_9BACT|nr:GNAT family N-acetyltransferase [Gemmata massiliana]VTR92088.1 acetyltransferase : GCN5-like protein N-acetyltransferase OS=uncultured bacterium GN=ACD_34C00303G0003 PE=4 SV=1: Acetyltransf_1 [Gemmata massiliana]
MTTPNDIDQLTRRDERVAVASLSAAFANYDLLTALCPDVARRRWAAEAFARFLFRIAVRTGIVFATRDRAAVVCALPPGSEWPSEWEYVRCGVLSLAVRLRWRSGLRFMRLGPWFDSTREKHVGDRPHWYVHLLGVRPEAQGRGLSRAVMRPIFESADRTGTPIYLETMPEANVAIYKKLGFALVGRTELPGGLPNWELLREPSKSLATQATGAT